MNKKVYVQLQTINRKNKEDSERENSMMDKSGDNYVEDSENIDDSNNITEIRRKIMEQTGKKQ